MAYILKKCCLVFPKTMKQYRQPTINARYGLSMSETPNNIFLVDHFWKSKNINVYTFELSFPFEEGTTACFLRLVFAILAAGESCRCCQTIVM